MVAVGDKFPAVKVDFGFPPEKVDLVQVPGYLAKQDALKAAGIDEVLVYCVNDGAVMAGWAREQKVEGSMITFLADPCSVLTKALGTELTHEGPMGVLGNPRCKRFAIYSDNGVIKVFNVSEAAGDPAGDDNPTASCVEGMLEAIAKC